MTTIFACHQGKERSVAVAGLYQSAGHDVRSFDGGIERMVTLDEEALKREVTENDDVVLICEPWGRWDPQLKAVEQAEKLLSQIGRIHRRDTTTNLMKQLLGRR